MKNKEIIKLLKREAEKLPPETYIAYPKGTVMEDEEGNKLEHPFMAGFPTNYSVNHGRRLKRLWNRTKNIYDIAKYFADRGFELKYT